MSKINKRNNRSLKKKNGNESLKIRKTAVMIRRTVK